MSWVALQVTFVGHTGRAEKQNACSQHTEANDAYHHDKLCSLRGACDSRFLKRFPAGEGEQDASGPEVFQVADYVIGHTAKTVVDYRFDAWTCLRGRHLEMVARSSRIWWTFNVPDNATCKRAQVS